MMITFSLLNWETFLKRGAYRSSGSAATTGSAAIISFLAYLSASSGAILQYDG